MKHWRCIVLIHKFKEIVKGSKILYSLYYYIMSFGINCLKKILKSDDKLILFVSYGGRHYSDSPRVIYESMRKDERFKEYRLVWAFVNPEMHNSVKDKIKIDTLKYYITALKARCWVTNVMVERALNFTGINTYYFFTTHGILVKCDGPDLKQYKFSSLAPMRYDCCLAQSEYEKKIEMRMFGLSEDKIHIVGYPKDDILVNTSSEQRQLIRKKLNIPDNKKAILYAPTFREDTDMRETFVMNIDRWKEMLSDEYVLLYRAHPVILAQQKKNDDFFYDVTSYEVVEDLMIASDILISDYSGIIFDYCIMHKPIYLWTYDYDEYQNRRGLYFDIRKELPSSGKEDEVIDMVKNHNWDSDLKEVILFQEKYETVYGEGTKNSIELIYENIGGNH